MARLSKLKCCAPKQCNATTKKPKILSGSLPTGPNVDQKAGIEIVRLVYKRKMQSTIPELRWPRSIPLPAVLLHGQLLGRDRFLVSANSRWMEPGYDRCCVPNFHDFSNFHNFHYHNDFHNFYHSSNERYTMSDSIVHSKLIYFTSKKIKSGEILTQNICRLRSSFNTSIGFNHII